MVVEVAKEQFHIEKEKQTLDPMENAAEECKTYPENLPPNYTRSFRSKARSNFWRRFFLAVAFLLLIGSSMFFGYKSFQLKRKLQKCTNVTRKANFDLFHAQKKTGEMKMKRSDAENGGPIGHRGPGLHDDKMDRFRKFADNLVGRSGPGHDDEKDRPKKSRGNDRRKGGGQRKGKGRRGRKGRGGSRPSRPEDKPNRSKRSGDWQEVADRLTYCISENQSMNASCVMMEMKEMKPDLKNLFCIKRPPSSQGFPFFS